MIILDADDMLPSHDENPLNWLIMLKHKYPQLKVTLFTVLGGWNVDILRQMYLAFPWIEFAAHGLNHKSNDEVLSWDKKKWFDVINQYEQPEMFAKIFKAPNWEMSRLGYEVLKDLGWAVAVRESQIEDLPRGMMYYSFEKQKGTHGHTWLMSSHITSGLMGAWKKDEEFKFVSESLLTK